jgi:glycerophosphoryl diester phosphodiesterase
MVMVVGHRGAAGVMPENTIPGFEYAIRLGVDAVECDVHLSRDEQLVVMHDRTVERTTNGHGAIRDLSAARLGTLDAGGGARVPRLAEVLETARGRVTLLCELKGVGVERAAVAAVQAAGMADQVIFSSFVLERLAAVRSLGKQLRLAAILPDPTDFEWARATELGAENVDVYYRNVNYRILEEAQRRRLRVVAWNPDTWREQRALLGLGVEVISTNRPDLLLAHLGALEDGAEPTW